MHKDIAHSLNRFTMATALGVPLRYESTGTASVPLAIEYTYILINCVSNIRFAVECMNKNVYYSL
jgi:hypothetical protein